MMDTQGRVHIETALAGASSTAGALLLRTVAGDLVDTMEPGTAVFSDRVSEGGPRLLGLMESAARAADIPWDNASLEIPPEHQPHEAYIVLVRRLEPVVTRVM